MNQTSIFDLMEQVIKLKDALNEMNKGEPFNLSFITADKRRNVGGEIIQIKNAVLSKSDKSESAQKTESVQSAGDFVGNSKAPNHYQNSTRNLLLSNNKIRKVHIWLITTFNDKKVVL